MEEGRRRRWYCDGINKQPKCAKFKSLLKDFVRTIGSAIVG
jgi:hypothetical protein